MSLCSLFCNRQDSVTNKTTSSTTALALTTINSGSRFETASVEKELHQRLPSIEKRLQHLIDDFNVSSVNHSRRSAACSISVRFRSVKPLKVNLEREVVLLRKLMRRLRRWRNGSEYYTATDIWDLRDYVTRSRERLLMHKMERIYDDSAQINHMIGRHQQTLFDGPASDAVLMRQEKSLLDGLMDGMNEMIRTKSNKGVSLEEIPQIEEAINEVKVKTENLKERLGMRLAAASINSRPFVTPSLSNTLITITTKLKERVENQPLINNLLRYAGRIRRMIEALHAGLHCDRVYCSAGMLHTDPNSTILLSKSGYNAHQSDGSASYSMSSAKDQSLCADNDILVLSRQLTKLKRWLQEVDQFTEADLEDLDLIVSAIERHLRPDVDLNSPSLMPNCDILVIDSDAQDSDLGCGADREGLIAHPSPPPCNIVQEKSRGTRSKSGGLKVKVRIRPADLSGSSALKDIEDLIDERLI